MTRVVKVKSAILHILRIVGYKIIDETLIIVILSKIAKHFKQMQYRWNILHNTWSLVKRHILILDRYEDVRLIAPTNLDSMEFIVFKGNSVMCNSKYKQNHIYARDEMQDFRYKFKNEYRLSYLGHIFTLKLRPATCDLLNEWLVYDVNDIDKITNSDSVYFDPPHVIVFDMDSTLITDEEEVQIRDPTIYQSLNDLRELNCVLCLWSYGHREHVVHSLEKVKLKGYFDIILSEGRRVGEYKVKEEQDTHYDVFYFSTPFYLDVTEVKNIPKSPRVVLWYLQKHKIGLFKTITLVDDLFDNNINYDNFVNLKTCPVPVDDWDKWHKHIVRYIKRYNDTFRFDKNNLL
ncbi:38k [Matsumuraeses phaseoli granulovirus]|uniref:38k n=1 Tax=Matsumuraeses phaseoli granulovirus TaxID=2760664 RepID=A0AAE7MLF1_9BBAC|nr:38k [Matsumuraeses phaseoli granulovirus]QOD40042.1 38k [Matsumuraeses phaseoli granulovirus]